MRGCQEGIRINTLLPGAQGAERPDADKKYRLFIVYGTITDNVARGSAPYDLSHVHMLGTPPKGILADTLWNPGRKLLKAWQTTAQTPAIPPAFFVIQSHLKPARTSGLTVLRTRYDSL